MKKLVYMLFFLIVAVSVKGQVQQPSGLPNPKSPNTYNIYGYTQDSAFLFILRNISLFSSKYPSLTMGLDTNLYKSNGNGGAFTAVTVSDANRRLIFNSVTSVTISNWNGNEYIYFGNNPLLQLYTLLSDGSYVLNSGIAPDIVYSGSNITSITYNFPFAQTGYISIGK